VDVTTRSPVGRTNLKDGMVAGTIPDNDPAALLAHGILGTTGHLARTFIRDHGEPAGAVADLAVSFCLGGLRGVGITRPGTGGG
jgi:hypothetical protein